jgi:hypothetical protein
MAFQHGSLELISDGDDDAPDAVTIQMSGPNVVVRSSMRIDRAATESVVHLLNSSVTTEVVVVIDPEQIRCSDAFASTPAEVAELRCCTRPRCLPRDVETVADGVVRVAGEQSWWTIDIGAGRFVRSDQPLDMRFVGGDAWAALQGVWITGVKLSVLTADGALVSGYRARADERCTRRLAS